MKNVILATIAAVLMGCPSIADGQGKKTGAKPAAKDALTPVKVKKPAKLPFKTRIENISYVIGLNFGRRIVTNLKRQGFDVDGKKLAGGIKIGKATITDMKRRGIEVVKQRLLQGFHDGLSGGQALLNDEQFGEFFREAQKMFLANAAERRKKTMKEETVLAEKNKKEGAAFLAKNKKKKGVKTLRSGLQYQVIRVGKGKSPKAADTVVTHYRGMLIDGREFDSSIKRGRPATFPVTGVIKGWTEALQLMKVGAKWRLFIPSDLAYKANRRSELIGPNATLIFDLELIAIQPPPKPMDPPK